MSKVQVAWEGGGAACLYGSGIFDFVKGTDGNLWAAYSIDRTVFQWGNLGLQISSVVGVITIAEAIMVFCVSADGRLVVHWWNGGQWQTGDLKAPGGARVAAGIGVAATGYSINVFVKGDDNGLYMCVWNGSGWTWENQGMPSRSSGIRFPWGGAVGLNNYLWAFVEGGDGHLWVNVFDPVYGWSWNDLATPPGCEIMVPVGSVVFNGLPIGYVQGTDSHLWSCAWTGSQWQWIDLGQPVDKGTGQHVAGGVGVALYSGWPLVFVRSGYDEMWVNNASPNGGEWTKLGGRIIEGMGATSLLIYHHQNVADIIAGITAGAVMAGIGAFAKSREGEGGTRTTTASDSLMKTGLNVMFQGFANLIRGGNGTWEQYPYAFARSPAGHLMVAWSHASGWQWSDLGLPGDKLPLS